MRIGILAVFVFLLSTHASVAQSLKDCFQDNDENSRISICLTGVYAQREAIRNIIEQEFEDFISDDKYITPPEGYNDDSEFKYKPSVTSGSDSNTGSAFDPSQNDNSYDDDDDQSRLDKKMIELQRKMQKEKEAKANLERFKEIKKQKIEFAIEQGKKQQSILKEKSIYERKKRNALAALQDSRQAYENYKESECKRQSALYEDDDPHIQDITLKTCYYDMTNHRIKVLQRSMAK